MKQHNSSNKNGDNNRDSFTSHPIGDEVSPNNEPTSPPLRPTRTSVDTIHLTGPFEIIDHLSADFTVEHSHNWREDVHLYTQSDGCCFLGRRAKANNLKIFVCIEPVYEGSREVECKVSFSAPAVLYGTNEHILSAAECEQAFDLVEQTLLGWGIEMNIRQAKLTRVDVLLHLEMNRPATCHVNVLHFLTIKHSSHTLNYPTSITRGNKSTQLHIYDKGAEIESKNRSAIGIKATSPEHKELLDKLHDRTILRVEWRLRNAALIRKELNTSSVSEFLERFSVLDPWLIQKMNAHLFREQTPYDVEEIIGKPPEDRPTAHERTRWMASKMGGTAQAVKQVLLFEALEQRMRVWKESCMPELRAMHRGPQGSAEFGKLQAELRKTMLWGLSVDGIPTLFSMKSCAVRVKRH